MANLDTVIQQLKDNKTSTDSIDAGVSRLNTQFSSFLNQQKSSKLKALETSAESTTAKPSKEKSARGFGSAFKGMGLGGLAKAGGLAALAGIAALAVGGALNGEAIKTNVEAILSIGDRYKEDTLKTMFADGAVVVALGGIGSALIPFAAGGALNAGVTYFAEDWASDVKDNVETLLSIGDEYTGDDALKNIGKDGAVIVGLGALGVALTAFGVGAAINAGVGYFAKGTTWSEDVATNVGNILGIADDYTLAGLGVLYDGVGVSAALTGLGVGLAFFAGGAGLSQFADKGTQWATDIATNVATLLSISNGPMENIGNLIESALFVPAMTGLMAGLVAFSVGSTAASTTAAITQFTGTGSWAQDIKDNVTTLLSISDDLDQNSLQLLANSLLFAPAMAGLAAGVTAFSAGTLVGAGAEGFTRFTNNGTWAQDIKDNVKTLLSIKDELGGSSIFGLIGESAVFLGAMGGLGLGMAALGAGAVVSGGADMLADWFTDSGDWAQTIYDNVETLLSISQLPGIGADTLGFIGVMGGIGAGLLAFAAAGTGTSMLDALSDWISPGEGRGNWTEEVKNNVGNILSIVENPNAVEKSDNFVTAMGKISGGLLAFAGTEFVGTLTAAGQGILSFFTGAESPFSQIMRVAEEAENLEKGANAVDSLTGSIEKLGMLNFDGSSINMSAFAEDLAASVPVIEAAIMGGTITKFGPFNDLDFEGLASPNIDYNTAISNISRLRGVLSPDPILVQPASRSTGGGGGGGSNVFAPSDSSVKVQSVTPLSIGVPSSVDANDPNLRRFGGGGK